MEILFYLAFALVVLLGRVLGDVQGSSQARSRERSHRPGTSRARRVYRVEKIAERLSGTVLGRGDQLRALGRFKGRVAQVRVPALGLEGYRVEFSIAVDAPGLTVELVRTRHERYRIRELVELDPAAQGAGLRVQQPRIASAVGALFRDAHCQTLRVEDGQASIVRICDETDLVISQVTRVLDRLHTFVRAWEEGQDAPQIKVAEAHSVNRLCPFCRDGLDTGGGLIVVRCDDCGTVQHGECFAEHSRCAATGCEGRDHKALIGDASRARQPVELSVEPCGECGLVTRGCVERGRCNASPAERRTGARVRRRQRARARREQSRESGLAAGEALARLSPSGRVRLTHPASLPASMPPPPPSPPEPPEAPDPRFARFRHWSQRHPRSEAPPPSP